MLVFHVLISENTFENKNSFSYIQHYFLICAYCILLWTFFERNTLFLKFSLPCLAMETHRVQQALTVEALRTLHNSLKSCPTEETVVSDPKGLLVQLMPHQKRALAWLLWRESEKPSGGILGWYGIKKYMF